MAKFKEAAIGLNLNKPSNSSFFCPVNGLHITLSDPVGVIRQVTPMILMKLKGSYPSLVNLDSRIDLETGEFKEIPVPPHMTQGAAPVTPPPVAPPAPVEEPVITEDAVEETVQAVEETTTYEATEEEPKPKKKRKK